jgi:hypothetical protein
VTPGSPYLAAERMIFVQIRKSGETRTAETTLTIFCPAFSCSVFRQQENAGQRKVDGLVLKSDYSSIKRRPEGEFQP